MRKASAVNVNSQMGGYSLFVGGPVSTHPMDHRRIEAIEVHVEEFPDGVTAVVNIMSGDKIVRQLVNCPLDIVYCPE